MHKPAVFVIMTKAPVCGAVKTRLAKQIGAVAATALTRALAASLLRETARDPRFRTVLAITPDRALNVPFAAWSAAKAERIAQKRGGLGERMQRIFGRCGQGPLIIAGTDIPFIRRETIADAFRKLHHADAVFGRAEDGGYWLVGLSRRAKRLTPFGNVRWSSPYALDDTLKNLENCRIAFAATRFDIDTVTDYRRYRSVSRGIISTKLQGRCLASS